MILRSLLCLLACLMAISGCASDTTGFSKDEAAGLAGGADLGRDLCEEAGWYGDGECDGFCTSPDPDCSTIRNVDGEGPSICVGVRGNGQLVNAHFSSLARIIEEYGLISGISGGSSASITSFLLESIEMNPYVQCDGCDNAEQAARAALLFKSLQGYFGELAVSDEAQAGRALFEIYQRAQAEGVESLLASDPTAGIAALQSLLESPDLRPLVNDEVLGLLSSSPNPEFHAQDILGALRSAGSFAADTPLIFIRPSVLSFPGLASRIGRVGSFYAAYEPVDGVAMESFLAGCATPSRGLTWAEASQLSAEGTTCGALFSSLVREFRAEIRANESAYRSRIDDPVGGEIHALISTSVLEGDAVTEWQNARATYLDGIVPTLSVRSETCALDTGARRRTSSASCRTREATAI